MEKFDEVSGIRFRYIEAGSSGDPAVLVHGFNFDSNAWVNAGVVDFLSRNHRVYAIDMPYGPRSRTTHINGDIDDYAAFLRDAVRRIGAAKPILMGASIGGATVLRYLEKGYDAKCGIVVGPVSVDRINLDNIKVPVLGIWGEHDTVSNPSNKELLGKKFRVITISGAGHPAYLDKPREFISAIADFLLNC
ncbi:MAG: alpha/beta fold hydrolase [Thermocladium sp.]